MTGTAFDELINGLTLTMQNAISYAAKHGSTEGLTMKGRLKSGLIKRGVLSHAGQLTALGRKVADAVKAL